MTQNPTLGYIGTGLMGTPMAGRLLSAGNKLVVWNRTTKKAQPLVDQGAIMGESAADVARQADIVFMCLTATKGGDEDAFKRVEPIVLQMAARFTLMGPIGAGQTTKLCNQVIVGCTMAVLAEATRLATNAGVDASRLPEALAGGFADSKPLQLFVPRMVDAQHNPPLGHVYTMLKDLDSVCDLARSCTSPVPFTAMAAEQFRLLTVRGGEEADALEIYKLSAPSAL